MVSPCPKLSYFVTIGVFILVFCECASENGGKKTRFFVYLGVKARKTLDLCIHCRCKPEIIITTFSFFTRQSLTHCEYGYYINIITRGGFFFTFPGAKLNLFIVDGKLWPVVVVMMFHSKFKFNK